MFFWENPANKINIVASQLDFGDNRQIIVFLALLCNGIYKKSY